MIAVEGFKNAQAVTPSDTTVFPERTEGLWIGGTGAVAVKMVGGQTATFGAVPAGTYLGLAVTQVLGATTATLIVRVW